jgi:hypothetical protein
MPHGKINFLSFVKDVSVVIENTAFAADLALHFPDNFHKFYDKNNQWHFLLESSIGLTLNSGLADPQSLRAINLVSLKVFGESPNGFQNIKISKHFSLYALR